MASIRLYPPLPARLMNAVAGLVLWLPALAVLSDETPLPAWSGLVLVPAGALLAWRGYRIRVECAAGAVTVFGYLHDRTIACADIVHLERDLLPAITWRDSRQATRAVALKAFRRNAYWPSLDAPNAANLRRLGQYITANRGR